MSSYSPSVTALTTSIQVLTEVMRRYSLGSMSFPTTLTYNKWDPVSHTIVPKTSLVDDAEALQVLLIDANADLIRALEFYMKPGSDLMNHLEEMRVDLETIQLWTGELKTVRNVSRYGPYTMQAFAGEDAYVKLSDLYAVGHQVITEQENAVVEAAQFAIISVDMDFELAIAFYDSAGNFLSAVTKYYEGGDTGCWQVGNKSYQGGMMHVSMENPVSIPAGTQWIILRCMTVGINLSADNCELTIVRKGPRWF